MRKIGVDDGDISPTQFADQFRCFLHRTEMHILSDLGDSFPLKQKQRFIRYQINLQLVLHDVKPINPQLICHLMRCLKFLGIVGPDLDQLILGSKSGKCKGLVILGNCNWCGHSNDLRWADEIVIP